MTLIDLIYISVIVSWISIQFFSLSKIYIQLSDFRINKMEMHFAISIFEFKIQKKFFGVHTHTHTNYTNILEWKIYFYFYFHINFKLQIYKVSFLWLNKKNVIISIEKWKIFQNVYLNGSLSSKTYFFTT